MKIKLFDAFIKIYVLWLDHRFVWAVLEVQHHQWASRPSLESQESAFRSTMRTTCSTSQKIEICNFITTPCIKFISQKRNRTVKMFSAIFDQRDDIESNSSIVHFFYSTHCSTFSVKLFIFCDSLNFQIFNQILTVYQV